MSKRIYVGGRIESAEQGGVVAGANAIIDDTKGKKQNVINSETDVELARLDNAKQDVLTFDNAPTEGSNNPVKSGGVYAADAVLQQSIEAILQLIPSAATALNQLADKAFVNSTVATDTATFRGTYNVVTDLSLHYNSTHQEIATALLSVVQTADNNDYSFVQIPVSDSSGDIRVTERYKFNGTAWSYEYDLNNSGFTADQWAAINSGITQLLVSKLSALPTAAELTTALAGKQATLTFDNVPTSGSSNPVKSGGVYSAIQDVVSNITAIINQMDATFNLTTTDGHITLHVTQENGVITSVQVQSSDIASAAALTLVTNRVTTAEGDIETLQDLYNALQQSAPQVIEPTDTWPVANPSNTVIYRVIDRVNTPPEYYSDYMWNGTSMVLMATYNNAVDAEPTAGSHNLVESGGVYSTCKQKTDVLIGDNIKTGLSTNEGYIKPDGTIGANNYFVYTDFIDVSSLLNVYVKIKYYNGMVCVSFYDNNQSMLPSYNIRNDVDGLVNVPQSAKYMRLCWDETHDGNNTFYIQNIKISNSIFSAIKENWEFDYKVVGKDIKTTVNRNIGYIKSDGTIGANNYFVYTDFIPVDNNNTFYAKIKYYNTLNCVSFYTSNDASSILRNYNIEHDIEGYIRIPTEANYIRFSWNTKDDELTTTILLGGIIPNEIQKASLFNKTIMFFGDSITAGTDGGSSYVPVVVDNLKCTSYVNKGIGGLRVWQLVNIITGEQIRDDFPAGEAINYNNVDIATIQIGTNGGADGSLADIPNISLNDIESFPYEYSNPSGTIPSATINNELEYFTKLFPDTFYGNLALCVEWINYYSNKTRIIIMTIPPNTRENYIGVRNAILDLQSVYSFDVIDAQRNAGLSRKEINKWSIDGIHLNSEGALKWGDYISIFLRS